MELEAKPLVSVIIPTHNRATLLAEALDSVYRQEGVGEVFALEVIVVDDASTDATPEVVCRYPRVRYVRLETNLGVSAARNAGIRVSTGKYVAWLDDDDLWLPHRLKAHVPVLEANPEAGLLYGQYIIEGQGHGRLWPDVRQAPSGEVFHAFLMEHFCQLDTCLARREVFQRVGDFDETIRAETDYEMCLRLAWHVPFTFIPGAVAIQRVSTQGTWFTHLRGAEYEYTLPYIVQKALANLPDTEDYTGVRRRAYATVFSRIAHGLARTGDTERMRSHVLTSLKTYPWMTAEPWVWTFLCPAVSEVACALALTSEAPITAVREFCAEVRAPTERLRLQERLRMQRMLAQVWEDVSAALGQTNASQSRRATGLATLYAVLHNPTKLRRKVIWKCIAHTVFAGRRS
jgi:glycosyltransferase involved in cell wall biosynthesis